MTAVSPPAAGADPLDALVEPFLPRDPAGDWGPGVPLSAAVRARLEERDRMALNVARHTIREVRRAAPARLTAAAAPFAAPFAALEAQRARLAATRDESPAGQGARRLLELQAAAVH